ncbi:arsenate-mycothiol transferase ArsC [Azohydromonas caseinilytica]|uniref:Phosphotyrosine protein phosphatase n=1 Tax=Azohydromonas caseinilytica TaxID=2728836 RepID=A0A848F907_9BURK|nr:phosphotyrosine protein phosphatase [Azohydromonas caseinilytica]NML15832.1 phosphotyrosine protein phosphatase [Azohydromonas caseinilytica]
MLMRNFGGFKGLLRLLLTQADYVLGPAVKFTRPDLSKVDRLVFVCLANLKRSAFAQAVGVQAGLNAASFGLQAQTGRSPSARSVDIAGELGCPIGSHQATNLPDFEPAAGDLYLVMESRHAYHLVRQGFPPERVALLGHWARPQRLHIQDPYRMDDDYMRSCFALIRSAVLNLGRELRQLGRVPYRAPATP